MQLKPIRKHLHAPIRASQRTTDQTQYHAQRPPCHRSHPHVTATGSHCILLSEPDEPPLPRWRSHLRIYRFPKLSTSAGSTARSTQVNTLLPGPIVLRIQVACGLATGAAGFGSGMRHTGALLGGLVEWLVVLDCALDLDDPGH